MSTKHYIIPIFVPHIGCPNDCIFCNQKKIATDRPNIDSNIIKNMISSYISTIPERNRKLEIAFFGGSFTGIDIELQRELLETAYYYKKNGYVDRIRLSTRPDYIDENRLNILKQYNVDIIELGVQSMDDEVLLNSYRGHSKFDVINASKLINDYGFILGLQMMIGLPTSNYEKELFTAKQLISLNPSIVRIYPTLVIKDTFLEKKYYKKEYIPLTLNETVTTCMDLLMLFNYYDINVIRIGLQPTENIAENKDVIAGPFHPAIRQLIEEKIYKEILKSFFEDIDNISKSIQVNINKREISNFVGQSSSNLRFLKDSYGIDKVKIIGTDIDKSSFYIIDKEIKYKICIREYSKKYLSNQGLII